MKFKAVHLVPDKQYATKKEVFSMPVTDPVADMLTRIRNALVARHEVIDMPASKMKKSIAQILLAEGFIKGYEVVSDGALNTLKITLKYGPNNERVISGLKRISKPGIRKKRPDTKGFGRPRDCHYFNVQGNYDG